MSAYVSVSTSAYVSIVLHTSESREHLGQVKHVSIRQRLYLSIRQHCVAYVRVSGAPSPGKACHVSIRQRLYLSIRQHTAALPQHTSAYVRQHLRQVKHVMSAYVSVSTSGYVSIVLHTSAYVREHLSQVLHAQVAQAGKACQQTSASLPQHTSAYVSIRQGAP
jgi:hypothetical protein